MSIKVTHEMYVERLKDKNPNIEVFEEYKGMHTKIKHRCRLDGFIWEAEPSNILQGKGCPECNIRKQRERYSRSTDEYIDELKFKNPNIIVLEDYRGANVKIKHKCLKHDYVWDVTPSNVLRGSGCPKCKGEAITLKKTKSMRKYLDELKEKEIDAVPLEDYKGADVKIKHKCLKHDVEWEASPSNILKGKGCQVCRIEKTRQKRAKPHEKYVEEMKRINPDVEVIGRYINVNTPITHHCLKHDVYWETTPASMLQGCGCPVCKSEKLRDANVTNYDEFMDILTLFYPDYELIGEFKGVSVKTTFYCKKHDLYWDTYPYNIFKGMGCNECRKDKMKESMSKPHEQYINELCKVNPNIEVLEPYVNSNTHILHRCKKHNYEWLTPPASMLKGSGCPECMKEKISNKNTKTHEQYLADVAKINPDIEVLGEYQGADLPILHRCKKDGHEWMVAPHIILIGHGCPMCNETNGERRVRQFLEANNILYEEQKRFDDCRGKKPLPFDFYLPEYNSLIEYDGEHHYFPINFSGLGEDWAKGHYETTIMHDEIKDEYCKKNNIHLLRIPYFADIGSELQKFLFA